MGVYDNPLFLLFLLLSTTTASASVQASPLPLPAPPKLVTDKSPLRPSLAVVIGVLTTMFSITFLLLLYAKHCRRRIGGYNTGGGPHISIDDRKHSGIDRTLIELLPVFRFGALSGQKDGLECAVCLNQFDPIDVLRLLPKCKHAFHLECVDTWLDAHSTCPLCRYQVDPEDILLVQDAKIQHQLEEPHEQEPPEIVGRRISGRHSSAGEIGSTGFVRISIDSAAAAVTAATGVGSHRRSLDSISYNGSKSKRKKKKNEEASPPLTAERQRKDGLLLAEATEEERRSLERRVEHRIIVSGAGVGVGGTQYRWSDVQPSDLLYLRTEMIMSDSRRLSWVTGSRPSVTRQKSSNKINTNASWSINNGGGGGIINEGNNGWRHWQRWRRRQRESGRSVINTRSVSEITGLSRFGVSNEAGADGVVVSRWLAWRSQPAVSHSGRPSTTSNSSLS